jgi:beta-phosphoglucomutase-like phosphatase (HAD superfamily)
MRESTPRLSLEVRKTVSRQRQGGAAISVVPLSRLREEPSAVSVLVLPEPLGPETPALPYAERLAAGWLSAFAAAERALLDEGSRLSAVERRDHLGRLHSERRQVTSLLEPLAQGERSATLLVHCLAQPTTDIRVLALPTGVCACIFDVEGALTTSAAAHCNAWRLTLDPFLFAYTERLGRRFVPFDPHHDYVEYLSGRPRLAGLRAFLASRGISLPEGEPSDRSRVASVHGLAKRKQETLHRYIEEHGVDAFAGARAYLEVAGIVGARRAVVSASTNTSLMLQHAGIADLIDEQIDGHDLEREALRPKPAPDMLLAACARLGVRPEQAAAFEATPEGIAGARAAGLRAAIGVARDENTAAAVAAADADLVLTDLGELLEPSPF